MCMIPIWLACITRLEEKTGSGWAARDEERFLERYVISAGHARLRDLAR